MAMLRSFAVSGPLLVLLRAEEDFEAGRLPPSVGFHCRVALLFENIVRGSRLLMERFLGPRLLVPADAWLFAESTFVRGALSTFFAESTFVRGALSTFFAAFALLVALAFTRDTELRTFVLFVSWAPRATRLSVLDVALTLACIPRGVSDDVLPVGLRGTGDSAVVSLGSITFFGLNFLPADFLLRGCL